MNTQSTSSIIYSKINHFKSWQYLKKAPEEENCRICTCSIVCLALENILVSEKAS